MSKHSHQDGKPKYLVENSHNFADNDAVVAYLTARAADGWELVTVVGGVTFYFKAAT